MSKKRKQNKRHWFNSFSFYILQKGYDNCHRSSFQFGGNKGPKNPTFMLFPRKKRLRVNNVLHHSFPHPCSMWVVCNRDRISNMRKRTLPGYKLVIPKCCWTQRLENDRGLDAFQVVHKVQVEIRIPAWVVLP